MKTKQLLEKIAKEINRRAVVIMDAYLDKVASDATNSELAATARTMQASLLRGYTIGETVASVFPKMAADKRVNLVRSLVKSAHQFSKQANGPSCFGNKPKQVTEQRFHGKPAEGSAWMKK